MKELVVIQNQTGLSQSDLSQLLGVSRSHIAMTQNGFRSLDENARIKVSLIMERLKANSTYDVPIISPSVEEEKLYNDQCRLKYVKCKFELLNAQRTLSRMEILFEKTLAQYNLIEGMKDHLPEKQLWTDYKLNKLKIVLHACGPFSRKKLNERIIRLVAEEGYLKQFLNDHHPYP